jgi:hypothetical protein
MTNDRRNVLDVLKAELEFLENAGYHHAARAAWRPHFMFQDSPTCLNFDRAQLAKPCSDCVLMQLVPEDLRDKRVPCRYITLNENGETIDSFDRTGTQEEQETAVAYWLRTTIARLERERSEGGRDSEHSEARVRARNVSAVPHFVPRLGQEPSKLVAIGQGSRSPLQPRRINTIASRRTRS